MSENARALMREVMIVGQAEGATFPDRFVDDTLEMLAGPVGAHWTSMAQDRKAGRRMEWEVRNAVGGKIARRHRIPGWRVHRKTPILIVITIFLCN